MSNLPETIRRKRRFCSNFNENLFIINLLSFQYWPTLVLETTCVVLVRWIVTSFIFLSLWTVEDVQQSWNHLKSFNRKSYRPQNSSVFPHLCSSAKATSPSYSRRGTIWKSCSDPVQHDRHWRYYPPNHPTILKIIWKKKTKIAVKGINVTLDFVRKQLFLLSQIRHRFLCVKQSES